MARFKLKQSKNFRKNNIHQALLQNLSQLCPQCHTNRLIVEAVNVPVEDIKFFKENGFFKENAIFKYCPNCKDYALMDKTGLI